MRKTKEKIPENKPEKTLAKSPSPLRAVLWKRKSTPTKQLQPPLKQTLPLKKSQEIFFSPTLPSLSPLMLLSRSRSHNRLLSNPPKEPKVHHKSHSTSSIQNSEELLGVALCSAKTKELSTDIQLRRALKLKKIRDKNISDPYLFRGVPMVITFVRSVGSRIKSLWCFLEKASRADIKLAELEHPFLKKIVSFYSGWVPIYVHPYF